LVSKQHHQQATNSSQYSTSEPFDSFPVIQTKKNKKVVVILVIVEKEEPSSNLKTPSQTKYFII